MVGLSSWSAVYNNGIIIYGLDLKEIKTNIKLAETQDPQS